MKDRIKKVKNLLKRAEKLGLNIDKITEGKSIETLARSVKTIENLTKRFNRQKERPKIIEEVKQIDIKIQERKKEREDRKPKPKKPTGKPDITEFNRNRITVETTNELFFNKEIPLEEITKEKVKSITAEEAEKFLNKYFKKLQPHAEFQKIRDQLVKRFGTRLDILYDFMDYVHEQSMIYEYERNFMREEMPEEYNKVLYNRLDEFDRILKRKFKL